MTPDERKCVRALGYLSIDEIRSRLATVECERNALRTLLSWHTWRNNLAARYRRKKRGYDP